MGAVLKQLASYLVAQSAGTTKKTNFIIKALRVQYVLSAGTIGILWYSGYRNERVAPGSVKFPFPGLGNLKRKFPADRPEKELPRPAEPAHSWGNSTGQGRKIISKSPMSSLLGIPITQSEARSYHGLGNFEGKQVAMWIIPYLNYARQQGWQGQVTEGFRSYAEQVRIWNSGIRPAARPGTSNHGKKNFPGGAVDVTEAEQLARILSQINGSLLIWAGAKDPVHFSHPHNGGY